MGEHVCEVCFRSHTPCCDGCPCHAPMTPMRERLARAMEYERPDGPCCDGSPHLPVADRILAALGPDVFLVDVATVARRLYESEHSDGCRCDTRYPEVWQGYMDEARRLLTGVRG